jgi:hypothetical protein
LIRLLLAASVCFALLGACKSSAERAHQGQVANLAEHIDRLRRADNPDKRALLDALTLVPCPDATACGLKDLCVRAYRLHQTALDSIRELQVIAHADAGSVPVGVGEKLSHAESVLEQARQLTEKCAQEQVRVVRKALL